MTDSASPLVTVDQVEKRFSGFQLGPLSLSLQPGETLGLVGPNGAGKSTLLKLLMGFMPTDSGSISILGSDINTCAQQIKQNTAYVAEDLRLYDDKNLQWHIDLFKYCFARWDQDYAQHIAQRLDLNVNKPIKTLSLGQRIKANLLLALARRPLLMILDEPSTGLDPVARYELTAALFELMMDENTGMIFSSQFTQDVERLADNIAFIEAGELLSCQDKESYLDQWRRLTLTAPAAATLPDGLHPMTEQDNCTLLLDNQFSPERINQLAARGIEIAHCQTLTLEEIFIHQTLLRKQLRGH